MARSDPADSTETNHAIDEDVGPTIDLGTVSLPPAVADGFQTLYGTAERPRTVAGWVDATRTALAATTGQDPSVEDLCTLADGDHVFEPRPGTDDERQAYVCVLDPLLYPFLTDTPGTVRSRTQIHGETVTVDVTSDGVEVSHPDAVVSIGVSDHVEAVADLTPAVVYRQVCGYVHVFADEAEYETWATEVEAATTAVPIATGIAVAKELAEVLFGDRQA